MESLNSQRIQYCLELLCWIMVVELLQGHTHAHIYIIFISQGNVSLQSALQHQWAWVISSPVHATCTAVTVTVPKSLLPFYSQ